VCIRRIVRASGVLVLLWLSAFTASADTYARHLPTAPQAQQTDLEYEQRTVVIGGEPVTLIDVPTGIGDWDRPDPARMQTNNGRIVPSQHGTFQWFYGGVVGWMLVPAGWHLRHASIGADGSSAYAFVAPQGAASGWLQYSIIPACVGCIVNEADGLLPGGWERAVALDLSNGTKPWQPVPVPERLDHPDVCTALLSYRVGGLTVHGAVLSSAPMAKVGNDDVSLVEIYVALPAKKSTSADAIIASFRHEFPPCLGKWNLRD
jgi:hypothetical protein